MKEEEKKQSTPLYLNQQTAARDLGITRSTKPKAKAQSTVITPDVKLKTAKVATRNPFAVLPSDSVTTADEIVETDNHKEEEEKENEEKKESQSVVIDNLSFLFGNDGDNDEMNLVKGTLAKSIGGNPPNTDPTRRDVQKFQQLMADKLATFECDRYPGGYSWLVEREATHKTRVADATYTLPTYPIRPDHSILGTATTALQFKLYEINNKFFHTTSFWNQEAIEVIETAFPGALLGMETADNVLPASLTAREAIEHIITNVKSTESTHDDYIKLHTELMQLKFVPSPAGSEGYLKECRRIQKQVTDLEDKNCEIHDAHIMSLGVTAFKNSGHTKQFVVAINKEWEASGSTGLTAFTAFYNKALRSLYVSGDTGTKQHAFLTEGFQDRFTKMEKTVASHHADIGQVNDNIIEMAAMASGGDGTRSTMDMSTLSGTNVNDFVAMIAEQVQAKLKIPSPTGPGTNTDTNSNKGGGYTQGAPGVVKYFKDGTPYAWRCYDHYCPARGANFRCDGTKCTRFCNRKPNHDTMLGATYEDRKGGSDKNCDKWGKFRGPDDCLYDKKCDYKPVASG